MKNSMFTAKSLILLGIVTFTSSTQASLLASTNSREIEIISTRIHDVAIFDNDQDEQKGNFEKLPFEISQGIGAYILSPTDVSEFCKTSKQNREALIDKARLYDPSVWLEESEIKRLIRKLKVTKFEIGAGTKVWEIVEKQRNGYYIDPDQLAHFFVNSRHPQREHQVIFKNEYLVLTLLKSEIRHHLLDKTKVFFRACELGHAKVVKLLLKDERVKTSFDKQDAVVVAANGRHEDIVELMIKDGRPKPWENYSSALQWAMHKDHINLVRILLANELVDSSSIEDYAITWAARKGHREIVELLLRFDSVDPSANDNSALNLATKYDYIEIVKLLITDKRTNAENLDFAFCNASGKKDAAILKLLVDFRVNLLGVEAMKVKFENYPKVMELLEEYPENVQNVK